MQIIESLHFLYEEMSIGKILKCPKCHQDDGYNFYSSICDKCKTQPSSANRNQRNSKSEYVGLKRHG